MIGSRAANSKPFARPVLQSSSAIQTLSWVPRILHSQRAEHELVGAQEGPCPVAELEACHKGRCAYGTRCHAGARELLAGRSDQGCGR